MHHRSAAVAALRGGDDAADDDESDASIEIIIFIFYNFLRVCPSVVVVVVFLSDDRTTLLQEYLYPAEVGGMSLALQLASVVSTASLVVSNKCVLNVLSDVPNFAAMLVLVHNGVSMIATRSMHIRRGVKTRPVDWRWMLTITVLQVFSIFTSNIVLQLSSLTFHQLSRLGSIPVSQAFEWAFKRKKRSPQQLFLLALLCLGMYRTIGGDVGDVDAIQCVAASAMVVGALACAIVVRHVCEKEQINTAQLMYHITPWTLASAAIQVAFLTLLRSPALPDTSSSKFAATSVLLSMSSVAVLLPNAILAILVQHLSSWAAGNISVVMYAVLGQAKTVTTVALSAVVFNETLSRRTVCGMATCVGVATALSILDADSARPADAKMDSTKALRSTALLFCLASPIAYDASFDDPGKWNAVTIGLSSACALHYPIVHYPNLRLFQQ